MSWISLTAVYFIVWWVVLFAILPFGLRTQDDAEDITLGTVASAPSKPHMRRAFLFTTIVSALIVGGLVYLTQGLGYSFDDLPRILPDLDRSAS